MTLRRFPWRWAWLLALCAAPVIVVSLVQDIGAHAYDAAVEHILRAVAFSDVVSEGVLYPRWSKLLHWGLGSPLFTFQPPLPYYGMDMLYRLGLPHPLGWRVLVAAGFALAFAGAYLLVREITSKRWPALLAAVAYLYAPYVLRNALERGSNEAYSVFLYPLVLWGLMVLARQASIWRFLFATTVWAACIGSHVLGPLILAPFAAAVAICLAWRHRTPAPLLALLAGGLLTAAIWLPMVPEQSWVHVERDFSQPEAIPANNPIRLSELLAPPVIYDVARDDNRMGDRVGLLHTVLLLAGLPAGLAVWRRDRKLALTLLAVASAGLFLFFLLTPWSDPLWRMGGPATARLLYRTRLMGAQALAAALAAGLVVATLPHRTVRWGAAILAGVFLIAALPSLYPQLQHAYASFVPPVDATDVRSMEIRHGGTALTAFGEFEPRWRDEPFDEALLTELGAAFDAERRPIAQTSSQITVRSAKVENQSWDLALTVGEPATVTLYLLYYPRWHAEVDGQSVLLLPQPKTGYAQVAMPAGERRLVLRYARTATESLGLLISGLSTGVLCAVAVFVLCKRRGVRRIAQVEHGSNPVRHRPGLPVLLGLSALLLLKLVIIDPQTALFRCISTREKICGAETTVDVAFDGAHRLRGYSVVSPQVPGGELRLRLYWEAQARHDRQLSAFVHVRNSSPDQAPSPYSEYGIWAQQERGAWGSLLSTELVPGKLYQDEYVLHLPHDMPPGSYFLEVGWFDPATGEQADIPSEAVQPPLRILWRSVLLPDLQVVAP